MSTEEDKEFLNDIHKDSEEEMDNHQICSFALDKQQQPLQQLLHGKTILDVAYRLTRPPEPVTIVPVPGTG